jgi:hypothetical protein
MFCPNCGEKIPLSNQKFCHNCGCNISGIFKILMSKQENYDHQNRQEAPKNTTYRESSQVMVQAPSRKVGSFSKKCLAFSIISMILALFDLNLGSGLQSFLSHITYMDESFHRIMVLTLIFIIIINGIGLIFGIFASTYSKKARYHEQRNSAEVTGRIIGIIAIILNAISFILAFFSPWLIQLLILP